VTIDQQRTLEELAPRALVPSSREVAAGAPLPAYSPLAETTQQVRQPLRPRIAAFLRETDPREATRGEPQRPILVFATMAFMQALVAATVTANFLPILRDLDVSLHAVQMIGVLGGILVNFTDVAFGFAADRFRRTLLGTLVGIAGGLSYVILGFGGTLVAFTASRLLGGIFGGFGAQSAVQTPLMADYYRPEARGRVYSTLATLGAMGGVVGPVIGGALGSVFGWRGPVLVLGLLTALSALGMLFLKEPSRGRYDRIRLGASEETAAVEAAPPGLVEAFRSAKSIGTLRRVWVAGVFGAIGGGAIAGPLAVVTADRFGGGRGGSVFLFGLLIGAQSVGSVVGLALGGTFVDRLIAHRPGRIMVAIGGTQLIGAATFVLIALDTPTLVLLPVLLVVPFVSALPQMAKTVLLSLVVPARLRGFGTQSDKLFGVVGLICIFIILLAFNTTSLTMAFAVGAPPLAVSALLYMTASADVAKDMENARLAVVAEEEMAAARRSGATKLLVCRGVDVHYDGVQVLFGVDFDVDDGELVALLGTNGAGKSTLLRAISGLSEPTGGAVFLDGRDVTHTPPHELAAFGVVQMPGGKGVFPALTVAENLRTAGWLTTDGFDERLARVYELFPALRDRSKQLAGTLSGGEQQMVALGQALIMQPKILLIDELSLGLAPNIVEQLLQALEAMRESGTTIILVEQSVNLALTIADRAVFMEKGEIRFSGPTAELMRRPDILRSVYLKGTAPGTAPARTRPRPTADSSTPARTAVLAVEGVSVAYGGVRALTNATLDVAAAEIVGVVGPNGAGKTTLFDAVSGFVDITAGSVVVGGSDISGLRPDERAKLGLARSFQDARLFSSLTVLENIQVAMERHAAAAASATMSALWLPQVRTAERRLRRRAEGLIELLGLGAFRDKFVSELSTGSRRIVDLACVMATDPELLLLDEPSSGIAQAEAEELGPLLQRIRRDVGCGLLVIEHDIRLLGGIADRLVGMVRGETIVTGTVDEVLSDPTLVAAYLGTSERVLARSGEPVPPSGPVRSSS
jgi:branched-chain amino acid transport system ATP-binding protein